MILLYVNSYNWGSRFPRLSVQAQKITLVLTEYRFRAIKSLWQYLEAQGHDLTNVKAKIQQIIIKAIIASVPTVSSLSKSNCKHRHTCHELFGFDIFLDSHLKPWLIEVGYILYSRGDLF